MATPPTYSRIITDGLWSNNQSLVALLGLCSLLATTTSATSGLGMGIATTFVLTASNVSISLIRPLVRPEVRIPVYVVVIASFVTMVELTMQAWFFDLYQILGLFISLIVVNCIIIARAEAFASKNRVDRAFLDGVAMGLGSTLVLVTLGGLRELIGQGTLFSQSHLLLGDWAKGLSFSLGDSYHGALIAILPPGGFIGLGLLIALKNVISRHLEERVARLREARGAPGAAPEPAVSLRNGYSVRT
jgi:Na+-translocating ferredoxin:NAD+ oxidoreductase subunit E